METKALADKYTNGGMTNTYPKVATLLDVAHNTYYDMCLANTWTGVTTKAKATAFPAAANAAANPGLGPCWNCGGENHTLRKCPKPRDNKRIEKTKRSKRPHEETSKEAVEAAEVATEAGAEDEVDAAEDKVDEPRTQNGTNPLRTKRRTAQHASSTGSHTSGTLKRNVGTHLTKGTRRLISSTPTFPF